jgi:condensin complex subunit 3
VIAPLLGKLYISAASSEEKIRETYADVSEAVDNQLLSDATGRNALYKIHVSLGKIVNNLDAAAEGAPGFRRSVSRGTSVGLEDRTVIEDKTVVLEADIKEEEEEEEDRDGDSNEGTVVHKDEADSLVEDLLTDGET